jgi:hypothetical protein
VGCERMKVLIDFLRKHREIYDPLRKIYGATIGLWWFKKWFISNIGIYNGKKRVKLVDEKMGDLLVAQKIKSGKPFIFSRYGTGEFRSLFGEKDFNLLCFYSGFFPNDPKLLKRFRKIYFESSKSIDVLAVSLYMNQFVRKIRWMKNFPNIEYLTSLFALGPFNCSWVKELKNKKVLVVHPFKKTIESQHKRADKLGVMPKLKSLEVVKAVQTLADNKDPRFNDWFEALDYMKKEIDKKDFDIALIGCGAYGLPLAAHVKSMGKQALHVGGGVQLFFGIKGARWDDDELTKYNKYWVSPMKEDFMADYKKIEGGCYW